MAPFRPLLWSYISVIGNRKTFSTLVLLVPENVTGVHSAGHAKEGLVLGQNPALNTRWRVEEH